MRNYAVVIPTSDRPGRPGFLVQAVDSVLGQTLPAAEIIVASDGPAGAVRKPLIGRPVEIRELPKTKEGMARARNAEIAASSSDWICFLDDDDLWHPNFLFLTNEFLSANNDVLAVNTSYWTFGSDEEDNADLLATDLTECLAASASASYGCDTSYMQIHGRSFELLLGRHRVDIRTATVRRDLEKAVGGFSVEFADVSDSLFFVNVARFVEWHYIPKRLAFRRLHPAMNTRTDATLGWDTLRAIHHMWNEEFLPTPAHRPLKSYGRDYRFTVQQSFWGAIRNRRLDVAQNVLRLGMPLLPNWWDRIFAWTPPQITWRIERMRATIKSGTPHHSVADADY